MKNHFFSEFLKLKKHLLRQREQNQTSGTLTRRGSVTCHRWRQRSLFAVAIKYDRVWTDLPHSQKRRGWPPQSDGGDVQSCASSKQIKTPVHPNTQYTPTPSVRSSGSG